MPSATQPLVPPQQKEPRLHGRTAAQRAGRNARDARRLAAVSGVVIPSKIPPGHLPDQGTWEQSARTVFPCAVCGRRFVQKHQVKVHMAPCVARNGNPNGVRWDDAWNGGAVNGGAGSRGDARIDEDLIEDVRLRDYELEDSVLDGYDVDDCQPADYELPESRSGGSQGDSLLFETIVYDDPQSISPLSTGLPQPDVGLLPDRSQPETLASIELMSLSSPLSDPTPYDPDLRMDVLTNEALISMIKAWQDFVQCVGDGHHVVHLQFQRAMHELGRRGMVDEGWTWIVDLETVDMACRRVVIGESEGLMRGLT